jgi:hypothetical protein
MSHSLQSALAASTCRALLNGASARTWWQRGRVWFSSATIKDLTLLRDWLTHEDARQLWIRPIGMLVQHQPHTVFYSEASYAGLGGWSLHAQLQWRVMQDDLVALGFPMKIINRYQQEPLNGKDPGLHINPLEFLGAIINVWLIIVWRKHATPLSWLRS